MVETKPTKRILRCAVYTRKSSEEGLEQDFNSLEAQREACESYIKSQAHEGWTLIPDHFDDGGFSGGNMDRPALTRLMDMIHAGAVDTVVIYKIDRLTRSLMDFAKLAETFDKHSVSFVSVTQSFNTTDSMGRLMLNVLLSFAQFERELTGERIRDKFVASKKRGMWMGGPQPLGYDVKNRQLIVNPAEAETVRTIFDLYLELGNVRLVEEELRRLGLRTKSYVSAAGRQMGDLSFTRGHLYKILSNPLYIGYISHKGERHKGLHDAIVDRVIWDRVQAMLTDNTQGKRQRANAKEPSLLAGLLIDEFGNKLTATHAVKGGKRYRYYASKKSTARGAHNKSVGDFRIPAKEIEDLVVREVTTFLQDASRLIDRLGLGAEPPQTVAPAMEAANALAQEIKSSTPAVQRTLMSDILVLIEMHDARLVIRLGRGSLLRRLVRSERHDEGTVDLDVTASVTRHGRSKRLVVDHDGSPRARGENDALVRAVVCGRAWFEELASGRASSFGEIAQRVGVTDRYVSRIVDLAFLAPGVVEAVLTGGHRADVTVKAITIDRSLPIEWGDQRRLIEC